MAKEEIFTVAEVAERLKLEPVSVRRMLAAGRMAGFKIGQDWRVTESDLRAFIEANRPHRERRP